MDLSNLGKTVAKYAPLLGAVLPVPGGAAIGALVAQAFGGDLKDSQDLINRIEGDPNAELKLAEIQSNQKIEIEKLAVDRIRAGNEDRANARNREIQLKDSTPADLAKIFIGGYFILSFLVLFAIWTTTVTADEIQPIMQMLKDMSLAVMLILAYYYGASNKKEE